MGRMRIQARNMLKAGSGIAAPITVRVVRVVAVALAVLWPFALLLPINSVLALAVGVPYAALSGTPADEGSED